MLPPLYTVYIHAPSETDRPGTRYRISLTFRVRININELCHGFAGQGIYLHIPLLYNMYRVKH